MAFSVTEVQPTPNPNAMKFLLDRPIAEQPTSFLSAGEGSGHPIASRLFAIPGVTSLLMLNDFVTVNKTADANWVEVKSRVKQVLSEV